MPMLLLRLLTLVALVLMPFGMGNSAAIAGHHRATAAAGHCDDQGGEPAEQSSDQAIDCATACSMLATTESVLEEGSPTIFAPATRPLADRASGLHPDTATPPPKLS